MIANLQFFFIDKCIVDTVDIQISQLHVRNILMSLVVLKAQSFKQIHIDDGSSGSHHNIYHLVADHIHINLHTSGCTRTTGNGKNISTLFFLHHFHQDIGSTGRIAGGE